MPLLLHTSVELAIASFARELPQSLLLTGERGVGLQTIAKYIAGPALANSIVPRTAKGDIDANGGTISAETIRELYDQTRSRRTNRHVIIIDDADRMSPAAQASFLKLLEEPTPNTHFILTSHTPQRLLPTVRSRVQTTHIPHVDTAQSETYLRELGETDTKKLAQCLFIANGLPAELNRLVNDTEYFTEKATIMGDARTFITASSFEKLVLIHRYHSNRDATLKLLDSAISIARRGLSAKPQPNLVHQIDRLLASRELIAANANPRLQLLQFVV